jgi:hypothetical protein
MKEGAAGLGLGEEDGAFGQSLVTVTGDALNRELRSP